MTVSILDHLTPQDVALFVASSRRRRYRAGMTLFNEGDTFNQVFLLEAGWAKISFFTDDGREVVLAVRGPGDLLGELAAFDGQPRSATATALEEVEALVVRGEAFTALVAERPGVSLAVLRVLAERLRDADRKRVEFGSLDTLGRVCRRLLEIAEVHGEANEAGIRTTVPLTQVDLAGWIGSSREAVSKALKVLRDKGAIETHRKGITVVDRAMLERRGEST